MALEKIWQAIPASPILEIGPAASVRVANFGLFRTEMQVILKANGQENLTLKVRRVQNGFVYLSTIDNAIPNLSAYGTSNSGTIEVTEQERKIITFEDQDGDRYERAPTNADRQVLVDRAGEFYTRDNPLPIEGTIRTEPVTMPVVINFSVENANEEVSFTIPRIAKSYLFKVRNADCRLFVSYLVGQTNTNYITLERGCFFKESGLSLTADLNIYIRTSKPNQIIEIQYWM